MSLFFAMENYIVLKRGPKILGQAKLLRKHSTRTEKILWEHLQARRFHGYKFRRQVAIGKYITDFYCAELQLIVELDGAVHELRRNHDRYRDEYLIKHGYKILRFRNDEVLFELDEVLNKLRSILDNVPLPSTEGEAR